MNGLRCEGAEQVIGHLEYIFLFAGVVDKVTREMLDDLLFQGIQIIFLPLF